MSPCTLSACLCCEINNILQAMLYKLERWQCAREDPYRIRRCRNYRRYSLGWLDGCMEDTFSRLKTQTNSKGYLLINTMYTVDAIMHRTFLLSCRSFLRSKKSLCRWQAISARSAPETSYPNVSKVADGLYQICVACYTDTCIHMCVLTLST